MSLIILFALLLTPYVNGTSKSNTRASSYVIINSTCTATLYPDICYSVFSTSVPDITKKLVSTKKDVIELAINKTKDVIQANLQTIAEKLSTTAQYLTKRALHECLELGASSLEDLDSVIQELSKYPTKELIALQQQAENLKTLLSTTITNKETCLDGILITSSASNYKLHKSIIQDQEYAGKMCSIVLDMIKSMTDTDVANNIRVEFNTGGRKLKKEAVLWPKWLSNEDRTLLQLWGVKANVTVDKNGKGNYTTVAEAVAAAPEKSNKRYVIKITAGVYNETVEISKRKTNIMFIGEGRSNTIITGNKNVASGRVTTTASATVAVLGGGFLARDITFQNTAGPSGHQAVALRVNADLSAFHKCGMEGYQDTLYVHSNRQFYTNCLVIGTVDFIFGNAAVVFQFCDILARKPNPGQRNMVTAQGRTDRNQNTGIVIHKCNISATDDLKPAQGNFPTYLGRPWKEFSRTVVMRTSISDVIKSDGWYPWEGNFALDTLYYREYQNNGHGSDTSKRVTWKGWGVIKDRNEAKNFTVAKFIDGWGWLLFSGFPFWPFL